MKIIILQDTLPLICKSEQEFTSLTNKGYNIKSINNIKYLIKDEK